MQNTTTFTDVKQLLTTTTEEVQDLRISGGVISGTFKVLWNIFKFILRGIVIICTFGIYGHNQWLLKTRAFASTTRKGLKQIVDSESALRDASLVSEAVVVTYEAARNAMAEEPTDNKTEDTVSHAQTVIDKLAKLDRNMRSALRQAAQEAVEEDDTLDYYTVLGMLVDAAENTGK